MINGEDTVIAEERGEDALENLAVGQHVGNATGNAQVVFEYGELAVRQTDEIGTADADVNIARDIEAAHLSAEVSAAVDQLAGNHALGEDAAFVIDVAEE